MHTFAYVGLFALLGCLLRDVTKGNEAERRNARAILTIATAVTAVVSPVLLALGWAPP